MDELKKIVEKNYGHRIRIRVSGIAITEKGILMIKHRGIGENGVLWLPPGGGMDFGENAADALLREVKEETGLIAKIEEFMFVNEFNRKPFHAIELFFRISLENSDLITGTDPEYSEQIIEEVRFMSEDEIYAMDPRERHNVFGVCKNFVELLKLKGYVLFPE